MKNAINIFILLILCVTLITAQKISGIVSDKSNGEVLVGADVYIERLQKGTSTDHEGYFTLTVSGYLPYDSLKISFMGYKTLQIPLAEAFKKQEYLLEPQRLKMDNTIIIYGHREEIAQREIVSSVSQISEKEISFHNRTEITDILKSIPSVKIEGNDLSGRTVEIWGSNADEVNVYLDGILINMLGIKNRADLSLIPTQKIKKIDVLKGANLPLLGSGAFGGVVNIQTRTNYDKNLSFTAKYGSFDNRNLSTEFSLPLGNNFYIDYFGQYESMKPEIEYFPGEKYASKTGNDTITTSKQNHFIGLHHLTPNGRFSLRMINYFMHYEKPDWETDNVNYLFSAVFNGNKGFLKDFDLYLNHFYNEEKINRTFSATTSYHTYSYANRSNLKIGKKINFGNNYLQTVAEYFHDELISSLHTEESDYSGTLSKNYIYDNRGAVGGVFTFNDADTLLKNLSWKTYIGLRGDFIASGDKAFTKTIGGEFTVNRPSGKNVLFFNYGSNVKFPTLPEKAYIGYYDIITASQDTITATIEPEYIYAYQAGIKVHRKFSRIPAEGYILTISLFHNTSYNKLLRQPYNEVIIQTQNGRNITKGAEINMHIRKMWNRLNITASYNRLSISDKILYAYKPEESGMLNVQFIYSPALVLSGRLFYRGNSYGWYYDVLNELQTERLSPYWDADLAINMVYHIKSLKFTWQISGSNIFDSVGYGYYYLQKRHFQISATISL